MSTENLQKSQYCVWIYVSCFFFPLNLFFASDFLSGTKHTPSQDYLMLFGAAWFIEAMHGIVGRRHDNNNNNNQGGKMVCHYFGRHFQKLRL